MEKAIRGAFRAHPLEYIGVALVLVVWLRATFGPLLGIVATLAAALAVVVCMYSHAHRGTMDRHPVVPIAVGVVLAAAAVVGVAYDPAAAAVVFASAALAAVTLAVSPWWRAWNELRRTFLSVAHATGAEQTDPWGYWVRRHRDSTVQVNVDPVKFPIWDAKERKKVETAVSYRLGRLYEADATRLGHALWLHPVDDLPTWAGLRSQPRQKPGTLLLAAGPGKRPITVDLDKCPHALVVGVTGGGKTTTLHTIIQQALRWADVVVLDPKKFDHRDLDGRKNLRRVSTLEGMTAAVAEVRATITERAEALERGEEVTGRRLVLVVDEGATLRTLANQAQAEAKLRTPHPALVDLSQIARLGRAVRVHLVVALQRPDVNLLPATDPGEMRDNLGCRVVAGRLHSDAAAEMVLINTDACKAAQTLPDVPGRGLVEVNGAWHVGQLVTTARRADSAGVPHSSRPNLNTSGDGANPARGAPHRRLRDFTQGSIRTRLTDHSGLAPGSRRGWPLDDQPEWLDGIDPADLADLEGRGDLGGGHE